MKSKIRRLLIPAVIAGLAPAIAPAAPLAAGDKIGIDFGPTTTTTNWNNITSDGQSIAAGAVINRAGASLDGVSITTAKGAGTGFFSNNDGSDTWVGLSGATLPDDFVDSVTTDIVGVAGGTDTYTITLGGLNASLRYNLHAVSTAAAGGTRQDSLTVVGDASYGPSTILRSTSHNTGTFHSFLDVGTDGSGVLVITLTDLSAGNNPIVNGILIEAVVPPTRWVTNGSGDWSTPANWSSGAPNAPSAAAALGADGGNITGPVTATLDVPVTLGALQFNHSFAYTVAGANALTFDNAGNVAVVGVQSGDHEISAPLTMAESLAATVASGASLDLSGTLSDGGGAFDLVKAGAGNLVLSGDFSGFTGLTTITAGTVTLARPGDYTLTHEFDGAGRLSFTGGGRVTLAPLAYNSHGGTDVSHGGTLVVDDGVDLGTTGGVGFDNGTLEVGGDTTAAVGGWIAGAGGGTVTVASGFTLQGGRLTGAGTMNKTGDGTWRIAGAGAGATIGLFTVSAGTLDLDRNDTFGNHSGSTQNLEIGSGALVTNGTQINRGYNAVRNLTLDGGELRVTGTARALADGDLFKFEAYGIRGSITVTGTTASSITDPDPIANAGINIGDVIDLGGGVGADLIVDVADVTGTSEADLTVSAVLKNNYANAAFLPLANGLVKTGVGTLELTAVNRYTGNTSVEAGTLILDQAFLDDDADVALTTGATLQLDFAGTDTIDVLFIDDVAQATGTWGRTGHPTAEHTTGLITGDGLLRVGGTAPGYAGWAGLFTGFTDPDPDADFEGDGLDSGVEWVVDGDPTANDASSVAPSFDNTADPDDFLFTFQRRDDAAADPGTTIVVEYGSDLTGWRNTADHGVIDGVAISVDDNGFGTSAIDGTGVDKVTVAIPRTLAVGGKLFARLSVAVAP